MKEREQTVASADVGQLSAAQRSEVVRRAHCHRSPGWVGLCVEALLLDEDARVRAEAMAALEHAGAAEAISLLVDGLGSALRVARRRAAQALSRLPAELVRPRLEAGLVPGAEPRGRFGRECADLLGRMGDRRATPALLEALHHPDAVTRARAAASLGVLLEHSGGVVEQKGEEGAEGEEVVDRLLRLLGDGEAQVVVAAVRALGQLGRRRAVPPLLALAGREDAVGDEVAEALSRLGPGLVTAGECQAQVWTGELPRRRAAPVAPPAGTTEQVYEPEPEPEPGRLEAQARALATLTHRLVEAPDELQAGRLARALLSLGDAGVAALRRTAALADECAIGPGADPAGNVAVPSLVGSVAAARALLQAEDPGAPWAELSGSPAPGCRALAVRGLERQAVCPQQRSLLGALAADDPDPLVRWLAGQALACGVSWELRRKQRLAPHPRSSLPSAQPPYGLPLPDETSPPPSLRQVPPVALAACNLSISTNLGVLLRSAEAAGVREVYVIGDPRFHPGAARGTDRYVGLCWLRSAQELVDLADRRGWSLVAIQQSPAAQRYDLACYPPRPLFLLGAEAAGLPGELLLAADLLVEIPLAGRIDSLNVATAGTVVLFEWLRRQGFPGAW